jgi:5-amino-6-(5-phosphoribosylamino)uracil reductase
VREGATTLDPVYVGPVKDRPYVLLSCGMSIDGYVDTAGDERLLLSNDADFDRVDDVRAGCDAILVGAATVRRDNPRLLIRDETRRKERLARGVCADPVKVTVTGSCDLDPGARFFTSGEAAKLVYCAGPAVASARRKLGGVATVVDGGDPVDLHRVTADLAARGVGRLMVEGGGTMHTQFLTAGLADELQLVVAPFFVGDSAAPRFVGDGTFPWGPQRRADLTEVRQIGDVVLLRYALSTRYSEHGGAA